MRNLAPCGSRRQKAAKLPLARNFRECAELLPHTTAKLCFANQKRRLL